MTRRRPTPLASLEISKDSDSGRRTQPLVDGKEKAWLNAAVEADPRLFGLWVCHAGHVLGGALGCFSMPISHWVIALESLVLRLTKEIKLATCDINSYAV